MSEKLCIFCKHFQWTKESCWGVGSTMTGPMMEGGDTQCGKGHAEIHEYPSDEADFRRIILFAQKCPDYDEAKS